MYYIYTYIDRYIQLYTYVASFHHPVQVGCGFRLEQLARQLERKTWLGFECHETCWDETVHEKNTSWYGKYPMIYGGLYYISQMVHEKNHATVDGSEIYREPVDMVKHLPWFTEVCLCIPDGAGFLNSRKHIKIKEHGVMVVYGSFVAFFWWFMCGENKGAISRGLNPICSSEYWSFAWNALSYTTSKYPECPEKIHHPPYHPHTASYLSGDMLKQQK